MDVVKTSIDEFTTGSGTADATPKPIVAAGYATQAYKGVTVRATAGALYVGSRGVTAENGFPLEAGSGEELFIPVNDPGKVYVVGNGSYSWVAI